MKHTIINIFWHCKWIKLYAMNSRDSPQTLSNQYINYNWKHFLAFEHHYYAAEYVLTIPGEQFSQMRESGILGDMLDSYVITEEGEYNVVLTAEQYQTFQTLVNQDTVMETVSQAQGSFVKHLFNLCYLHQCGNISKQISLEIGINIRVCAACSSWPDFWPYLGSIGLRFQDWSIAYYRTISKW